MLRYHHHILLRFNENMQSTPLQQLMIQMTIHVGLASSPPRRGGLPGIISRQTTNFRNEWTDFHCGSTQQVAVYSKLFLACFCQELKISRILRILVVLPGYRETVRKHDGFGICNFSSIGLGSYICCSSTSGWILEFRPVEKRYALGIVTLSPVSSPVSSPAYPQDIN